MVKEKFVSIVFIIKPPLGALLCLYIGAQRRIPPFPKRRSLSIVQLNVAASLKAFGLNKSEKKHAGSSEDGQTLHRE